MKKILYIKKYIKTFQICEKLSKSAKISTKLSKEINEIQNYFSKKQKKNDLLKSKIHQKIKYFNNKFFFFSNSRCFSFYSRLSFVIRFQRNLIDEIIVVV